LERLDVTQEEVARRVGKDRSSIANSLRLLRLPQEVQKLVEEDKLSMGHARALLPIESVDRQKSLAIEIITKTLSVRETEKLVKRVQSSEVAHSSSDDSVSDDRGNTANVFAAEQKLSNKLGSPVKIKFIKDGGTIEIKFSSSEDLTRLFDLLIQRSSL
jgi:ParB family chromosome partitioning protein